MHTLVDDSVAAFRARSSPIALHLTVWGGAAGSVWNRRALGMRHPGGKLSRSRRPGCCEFPTGEPRRQRDAHPVEGGVNRR